MVHVLKAVGEQPPQVHNEWSKTATPVITSIMRINRSLILSLGLSACAAHREKPLAYENGVDEQPANGAHPQSPLQSDAPDPVEQAAKEQAETNAQAQRAAANYEKIERVMRAKGFEAMNDSGGLLQTVSDIRDGKMTMSFAKKHLTELRTTYPEFDNTIEVLQVISPNLFLLKHAYEDAADVVFLLKGYAKNGGRNEPVEGMSITALGFEYYAIRGTQNYKTVLGTKQAIVIEPVSLPVSP
jgi:hypothetical protein